MIERPQSPCIKVCVLVAGNRCAGCLRTVDEIAAWPAMSAEAQWALLEALEQRRKNVAEDVVSRIKTHIGTQPAVLFMKGTPDFPQCGFSAQTVAALRASGAGFHSVNIFEDPGAARCAQAVFELAYLSAAVRERRAGRRLRHRARHASQRRVAEAAHRGRSDGPGLTPEGMACRSGGATAFGFRRQLATPHAPARARSALRHTPSSALHTSQNMSAVRSAS